MPGPLSRTRSHTSVPARFSPTPTRDAPAVRAGCRRARRARCRRRLITTRRSFSGSPRISPCVSANSRSARCCAGALRAMAGRGRSRAPSPRRRRAARRPCAAPRRARSAAGARSSVRRGRAPLEPRRARTRRSRAPRVLVHLLDQALRRGDRVADLVRERGGEPLELARVAAPTRAARSRAPPARRSRGSCSTQRRAARARRPRRSRAPRRRSPGERDDDRGGEVEHGEQQDTPPKTIRCPRNAMRCAPERGRRSIALIAPSRSGAKRGRARDARSAALAAVPRIDARIRPSRRAREPARGAPSRPECRAPSTAARGPPG